MRQESDLSWPEDHKKKRGEEDGTEQESTEHRLKSLCSLRFLRFLMLLQNRQFECYLRIMSASVS